MGAVPEESNEKRAFEIGWEFVQEYYTIMHHEPESLYKFYGNNSYFCYGLEGESTPYCHGKDEIRKRIGDIDYNECRVVVSNVDSQPSNNGGIIVQVLGEMLNRDEQAIKFAQTFFLAEQQNGYYVLNDIFRNLKDEVNDECEELMQQAEEEKEEEVKEEPAKVEEPVKPEKIEIKETKSEKVEETKLSPTKEKKQNEAAANKPQAKPQSQPAKPQPAPAQKPAPTKEAASTAKEAVAEAPKPTSYKVAAAAADKPATNSTSTTTSTTTPSRPMTYSSIASSNATSSAKTTWSKVAAQGDGNKSSVVVKQTISSSTQKHQDNRNNNNNNNQDKDSHTVFIKLPFNINIDKKYDINESNIEISDFYYEVIDNTDPANPITYKYCTDDCNRKNLNLYFYQGNKKCESSCSKYYDPTNN